MRRLLPASLLILAVGFLLAGCASGGRAPKSFTKTQGQSWSTIEVRSDTDYNRAWDTVLEILVKSFEIDQAIRDEGYIRTGWLYTWSGEYLAKYRVRITVKFSPDRTRLQFLPEAQFQAGENWILGTDTRLVSTIKTDLMGTVGRTTR